MMDLSALRERPEPRTFSVSELNSYIKSLFDGNRTLSGLSVRGEISNFVHHRSGHLYFSLKDDGGLLRSVMFASAASRLAFEPETGMKVIACGSVSVYPRDGSYQLYVTSLVPDGIGALYLAFEQLKKRLAEEGLFSEEHKKPLPAFPSTVGVITSPTGAAVRDIIQITGRRFPATKILLFPALVQGDGAEQSLIHALDVLDRSGLCDTIIIGRGGGSFEDLFAFNSEKLARRIYEAQTPVISAVGHETDFTICDFVADRRAPTPSAAAELAVPDYRDIAMRIGDFAEDAVDALKRRCERAGEALSRLCSAEVLRDAEKLFAPYRLRLDTLKERAKTGVLATCDAKKQALAITGEKLHALSPLSVLSRGYAIAEKDGAPLCSANDVRVGDLLTLRLADGTLGARVEEKRKGKTHEKNDI